ncbi:hypothetical protein V492_01644 [Pseudogymnoascus sp. VKM F-4246]|nr:hypothetical protein V492_01644 [Pseudogymnoascus sp. VKM F-4246]
MSSRRGQASVCRLCHSLWFASPRVHGNDTVTEVEETTGLETDRDHLAVREALVEIGSETIWPWTSRRWPRIPGKSQRPATVKPSRLANGCPHSRRGQAGAIPRPHSSRYCRGNGYGLSKPLHRRIVTHQDDLPHADARCVLMTWAVTTLLSENFVFDGVSLGWSPNLIVLLGKAETNVVELDKRRDSKPNSVEVSVKSTGALPKLDLLLAIFDWEREHREYLEAD